MADAQSWFEMSKYLGAGAAFVLGIVLFKVWSAYQVEVGYSKTRDRETLTILNSLTKVIEQRQVTDDKQESLIVRSIDELKRELISLRELIIKHDRSNSRKSAE